MRLISVGLKNGEVCSQCMGRITDGFMKRLNIDQISEYTDKVFHIDDPRDVIYCFEEFE